MPERHSIPVFWLTLLAACSPTPKAADTPLHPPGRYLSILGKEVWVETQGNGEPLVLLSGGGGGSHDYFHPWFASLADSFQVVYYDGFGRGRSAKAATPAEYSFERDVRELEELRAALGFERMSLFSHSFSGFLAQAYALRYPHRVHRLILSNTYASPGPDYQTSIDHLNAEVRVFLPEVWDTVSRLRERGYRSRSPELQQAYYGKFSTMLGLFYFFDPSHADRIVFSEETFNPEVYYQQAGDDADFVIGGDIRGLDFAPRLKDLPMPVLVMGGRGDGIVTPDLVAKFRTAIPAARVVMFERSGHHPFIEETDSVMRVIREFIR